MFVPSESRRSGLVGITAAVMAMVAVGCSGPDIVEKNLSNLAEAREQGVLKEGGWLPDFLPSSATDIRLRYDVDTNEVWIGFDRSGADLAPMDRSCNSVDRASIVFPRKVPRMWWPDALTADPGASKADSGYAFFKCSDGGFVAAAGDGKRSFYWFRPLESVSQG
jgi:hypothetical protein